MSKFILLSPELWPLIDVILCSYIELIYCGGVSCLLQCFYSDLLVTFKCGRMILSHLKSE